MGQNKLTYKELHKKLKEAEALLTSLRDVDHHTITTERDTARHERDSARDERDISRHMRDTALLGSREMEDAYIESEHNFRNSLDACPLGVRIVTEDGELIYANQAILDICGCGSIEELKAIPREQLYTPESYTAHLERKENRKRGKPVPPEYEIFVRRPDGAVRNLQVFRKEIVWGGERQFLAMYLDITERKRLEEALRESEGKFSKAFAASPEVIVISRLADGEIIEVNDAWEALSGYTREESLGKTSAELESQK